jgi:hypothetical protein
VSLEELLKCTMPVAGNKAARALKRSPGLVAPHIGLHHHLAKLL